MNKNNNIHNTNNKIKILIAYHKPDKNIFNDDILTPIHVGRAVARRNQLKELHWMEEHMIGDDTGKNISTKNLNYNEMTAIYWAWQNYEKLGKPEYFGFMHYRRHFIFRGGEKSIYEHISMPDNYLDYLGYSSNTICKLLDKYDFIVPKAQTVANGLTVYEHYKANHNIDELNEAMSIIANKYPEMVKSAKKYINGNKAYYYNMFIFKSSLFFEYANWIFDIMAEFEHQIESEDRRFFLSERLTGIFISYLIDSGKTGCFLPVSYIKGSINIPVAFATDENYAFQTYVAMHSIMKHASDGSNYRFFILTPAGFSEKSKQMLNSISNYFDSCTVEFINSSEDFNQVSTHIPHITVPTFYRLCLPKYLADYDKCIYLDSDTVICGDLRTLYECNVDDYFLAGVKAFGYHTMKDNEKYCKRNGLPALDQYINAGVLLINLKRMRKEGIDKQFTELLYKQSYDSQDQDIINICCYGKIKFIPLKFNAMTTRLYGNDELLLKVYSRTELDEARKNPIIIHYADKEKPWNNMGCVLASRWWYALKETPMWGQFCAEKADLIFDRCYNQRVYVNQFTKNKENKINLYDKKPVVYNYEYYSSLTKNQYKEELCKWFKRVTGKELNLSNPQTYNEKIQWTKLYDNNPLKTQLTDKLLVRSWVKERIGEKYLVKLLGVWDRFEDIDFDQLPQKFVLKATHGCEMNIIVKDKNNFDREDAKKKFDIWLNTNYAFKNGFELQYLHIKPRIIAEEYMENDGGDLYDYKFWCFDNKVHFVMFLSERQSGLKMNFFDLNWNPLSFGYYPPSSKPIPKPDNLDEMISISQKLCEGFSHVRVDLYRLNDGTIKFGEMTFTSASGQCKWNPPEADLMLGKLFPLPQKRLAADECLDEDNEQFKVSVILPVYNDELYLKECLDSVLNQTLKDIEVICIDDGSIDYSPAILADYEAKDSRVKVFWQENCGASVARNRGLRQARGEFVTFLDADDYYYSADALEQLYTAAKKHKVKVCAGLRLYHNRNGVISKNPLYRKVCERYPEGVLVNYEDFQHDYHYHSYIYERRMIIENNLEFPNVLKFQDPPFFIRAMYLAKQYYIFPVEMYCYRIVSKPPVHWKESHILAVLDGLKNSLLFSREHRLFMLHWLSAMRISYEYNDAIYNLIKQGNQKALTALIAANAALDNNIIKSVQEGKVNITNLVGVFDHLDKKIQMVENTYMLEPLLRYMNELQNELKPVQHQQVKIAQLEAELIKNRAKIQSLKSEIDSLQKSISYRTGRILTWFPRKVRNFICGARKYGMIHTIKLYLQRKKAK